MESVAAGGALVPPATAGGALVPATAGGALVAVADGGALVAAAIGGVLVPVITGGALVDGPPAVRPLAATAEMTGTTNARDSDTPSHRLGFFRVVVLDFTGVRLDF